MKTSSFPKAFYIVRVVPEASERPLRYAEKGGKHYVQFNFAVRHAARLRRSGVVVELWESRVDSVGWTELDLDKCIENLT